MTTPAIPLSILFPRDAGFNLQELLKIIQKSGISVLWAKVEDAFQHIIEHERNVRWGQEQRYALTVDAGGGAVTRLAQQGGVFAPGDRTKNILGTVSPKYQSITYQFERFHDRISKDDVAAYINSQKQEYTQKNDFQKSFMILQMHADSTGRQATPVGLGETDEAAAANFALASNDTTMKVKLSSLASAAGSASYVMEGSVLSFVYIDLDANNDGTNDVAPANAGAFPRILCLRFTDTAAAFAQYDAFRVVEVDIENDALYVMPAREFVATLATKGDYVQVDEWVPNGAAGAITVTPRKGIRADYPAVDAGHGILINNFAQVFAAGAAGTYLSLIHPLYTVNEQAGGKLQLGLGWGAATEMSRLNDGWLTGLETLLTDRTHTVHGIQRSTIRQYLPTRKDGHANDLSYNMLYSLLAQHVNRNRGALPEFSIVGMNPIPYSSMVSASENDRRISEGKGIRGEEGAKFIKIFDKKFQLESSSVQKKQLIYCIPDKAIKLKDGELSDITVSGQNQFLTIRGGQRVNVIEAYGEVVGELCVEGVRRCAYLENFKFSTF
jgi:hypothetical protein